MLATETAAVAIRRSHISGTGHGEFANVDYLGIRHGHACVGIDAAAVPTFVIDVELGLLLVLEQVVEECLRILA